MFGNLFGSNDVNKGYKQAQKALAKVEPMIHDIYDPYRAYGMRAMPALEEQYQMLLNNPEMVSQMLGGSYQQSPGYQFSLEQALNAANAAAAAGGSLGGTSHLMESMGAATGLASQDYWNYFDRMQDLYNLGLQGTQGQFNTGFEASQGLGSSLGNLYGTQANLAFNQGATNAKNKASLMGAGIGAVGTVLGGPVGGMLGEWAGNKIKGWLG